MPLEYEGNRTTKVYSAEMNNLSFTNTNGIFSGCEITPSSPNALTIEAASGRIFFSNDNVDVSSDTLTIAANATSNERIDTILIDSSGNYSVLQGTPSEISSPANYDAEMFIATALIFIEPTTTVIGTNNIRDIRVLNRTGSSQGVSSGIGRYTEAFTSQTSVTVNHNLGDDEPVIVVYNDSDNLVIPSGISITNENTAVVTFGSSTTGNIVVLGGAGRANSYYSEAFTSQTTWNVAHNLDRQFVQVQVFNASNQLIQPLSVTLTDRNNLVVTFATSTAGQVVVTGGSSEVGNTTALRFDEINSADVNDNELFRDDFDDALKYKGADSNIREVAFKSTVGGIKIESVYTGTGFNVNASGVGDSENDNHIIAVSAETGNYDWVKVECQMYIQFDNLGSDNSLQFKVGTTTDSGQDNIINNWDSGRLLVDGFNMAGGDDNIRYPLTVIGYYQPTPTEKTNGFSIIINTRAATNTSGAFAAINNQVFSIEKIRNSDF